MKTTILSLSILSLLSITSAFAQDRTTVTANNSEISDNLDLRAVASIFGESENLADFERRLNDPKIQISNLDLNEDNQVDYLRVIETIEGNAHLIVIQSVLGRDTYQDVATVEVQRDRDNRVQVQVVGDVYMYGANYIYEPVYVSTPVIYASFWVGNYRPYYSSWYWGYYPTYYYAWEPCPIFRYRSHIGICINSYNSYNYVNYRRCEVAYNSYRGRRGNAYESRYPTRSFGYRNSSYANRYELDRTRNIRTVGRNNEMAMNSTRSNSYANSIPRGNSGNRNESPRTFGQNDNSPRNSVGTRTESPRSFGQNDNSPRANGSIRNESPRSFGQNNTTSPRVNAPGTVTVAPRSAASPRSMNTQQVNTYGTPSYGSPRNAAQPTGNSGYATPRNTAQQSGGNRSYESPRSAAPREVSAAPRGNNGGGGGGNARGNAGGNGRR